MKKFLFLIFCFLSLSTFAGEIYNVKDFGAKGDGVTLDSPAINAAIDSAVANGGGQVFLPAGIYLSGSIHLKSNIDVSMGGMLMAFMLMILPLLMKNLNIVPQLCLTM